MKGKKTSILIIEDEWEYSDSLRDILEERGFSISESTTGEEGIKKIKASDFDVTLIDIKLPDMPGTQTLQKIREASPDTIPIMMTAYASIDSAIEALEQGAFAYLYKPVNIEELLIYINKAKEKKEMLTSHKIQADILDNMNLAVVLTNNEGSIIFSNKKANELFSANGGDLVGKDMKDLISSNNIDLQTSEPAAVWEKSPKVKIKKLNGQNPEVFLNLSRVKGIGKKRDSIIWTLIPVVSLSIGKE
jgi:ActR/RegA family two-component response regulator